MIHSVITSVFEDILQRIGTEHKSGIDLRKSFLVRFKLVCEIDLYRLFIQMGSAVGSITSE